MKLIYDLDKNNLNDELLDIYFYSFKVIVMTSGGLSNVVFYVGLPEHLIDTEAREPTQVLLRYSY